MKPFNESTFAVAWTGESTTSIILHGWDAVIAHIQHETGAYGEELQDMQAALADHDNWISSDVYPGDDTRVLFDIREFVYLNGLTIIRIIEGGETK